MTIEIVLDAVRCERMTWRAGADALGIAASRRKADVVRRALDYMRKNHLAPLTLS